MFNHVIHAEEEAVRRLGDQIGFGRLMQAAEHIWHEKAIAQNTPGSEHTVGPCAALLVPCECVEHGWVTCDWCCGTGRVTKRVSEAQKQ